MRSHIIANVGKINLLIIHWKTHIGEKNLIKVAIVKKLSQLNHPILMSINRHTLAINHINGK